MNPDGDTAKPIPRLDSRPRARRRPRSAGVLSSEASRLSRDYFVQLV